jgi:DNA polymerase I-like protein with 3'-5' exonuclease and polymerase domains
VTFVQQPLFDVASDWTAPAVSSLPSWAEAKRVAVDLETRDPQLKKLGPGVRRDGYVVGISFAIEGGPSYYLPVRHQGGGNLDPAHVWAYLRDQAALFRGDVVGANLSYDLDYLASEGVWFDQAAWFRDVLLAEPLIDELQFGYSLDDVSKRHGFPGKSEGHLRRTAGRWGLDPKAEMWKLPARHVAEYAIMDVTLPLALLRRQERALADQELDGIWDLESKVLPLLVKMRRRGVLVDTKRLTSIHDETKAKEAEARARISARVGFEVESDHLRKAAQVERMFNAIGVRLPVTEKSGKPSFDKDVIATIDHPLARDFAEAKKMQKFWRTDCKSIWDRLTGGRIHSLIRQLKGEKLGDSKKSEGVAFGRTASSQPNMQQQHARDPVWGPRWRGIFLADPGKQWCSADFSSQEPRMTVHYGVLDGLPGARELAAKFHEDNDTDLHAETARAIGIPCKKCDGSGCEACAGCGFYRKGAKTIFLGLCYGMGGGKLCEDLGLPTKEVFSRRQGRNIRVAGPEGQAIIDKFDAMVPFVRKLADNLKAAAEKRGYIRTILGRRCHFPIDKDRSLGGRRVYDFTHKALNRLIQGSSADQTKAAIVACEEAGHELQLLIHDELTLSVESREQGEEVARLMCGVVDMTVPSKVDIEIAPSWGESMA